MTPHCTHEPRPLPEPGAPYVQGECRFCWLRVNHANGANWAPPPPVDPAKPWDVAYLISLARRPERRAFALAECDRAGITPTVFDAVDGSKLPLPLGWDAGAGAYGCLESHRRCIELALLAGANTVLLLEDDVKFVDGFQDKLAEFMRAVPDDWDAVYLGAQVMGRAEEVAPGVIRAGGLDGFHRTHARILRVSYMKKVYQWFSSFSGHCDHIEGRFHKEFNVYGPNPWLALQGAEAGASDINGRTPSADREWTPKAIIKTGVPGVRQVSAPAATRTPRGQTVVRARGCSNCGKRPPPLPKPVKTVVS